MSATHSAVRTLPPHGSGRDPLPLLIDCDPGIDDAVALALALGSPELDVRAITSVAGNAPLELTTANTLRLLALLGRTDIPVAAGASRSLIRVGVHNQVSPHGENGLGGVHLPVAPRAAADQHAVDLMAGVLREAGPGSTTIAAIGPLTNVALLLATHPELTGRIRRLVVMAGTFQHGNITPVAEFNVWTDPEAARRVLVDSGLDIWMVGLDVTRRATLDEDALRTLQATSSKGQALAEMVRGYGDRGIGGWPMHDVLAIAAIIDPTLVRLQPMSIEVDTSLDSSRGQTRPAVHRPSPRPPLVGLAEPVSTGLHVAVDIDVDGFRGLVLDRVAGMADSDVPDS